MASNTEPAHELDNHLNPLDFPEGTSIKTKKLIWKLMKAKMNENEDAIQHIHISKKNADKIMVAWTPYITDLLMRIVTSPNYDGERPTSMSETIECAKKLGVL